MFLRRVLAITALLFGLFTIVATQCNRTQCNSLTTCDTGFGVESCTNSTTNLTYTNLCFYATHCSAYSQQAGDLFVYLDGPSPDKVKGLHVKIQNAILIAYNNFCRTSLNYMVCCPGSSSWPDQSTKAANVSAMNDIAELPILSVIGSGTSTTLVIRLLPNRNSTLCSALTYPTAAPSTTTTSATTTASITKAPANNSTAAPSSTASSAVANGTNSSTVTVPAGTTLGAGSVPTGTSMATAPATMRTTLGAGSVPNGTSMVTAPATMGTTPVWPPATSGTATSPAPNTGSSTPPGSMPMTSGTVGGTITSGTPQAFTSSSPMSSTSKSGTGRRRRDLAAAFEEPFENDVVYLDREKRAAGTSDLAISLSTSAIQNITSGMNLTGVVQAVLLLNSVNATATVSAASDPTTASPTATSVTVGRKSARSAFYSADIALNVVTIAIATIGVKTACTQLMPV